MGPLLMSLNRSPTQIRRSASRRQPSNEQGTRTNACSHNRPSGTHAVAAIGAVYDARDSQIRYPDVLATKMATVATKGSLICEAMRYSLNSAKWCAWRESNPLPCGPEPHALSGELQAR